MDTQEQEVKQAVTPVADIKPSREPFFGALLFGGIVLVVLGLVAVAGWGGYRGWRLNQERAGLSSIQNLSIVETVPDEVAPIQETAGAPAASPADQTASNDALIAKTKGTEIKILNGGAPKGSAGVVAETLKKAGYTKVTVGNTTGDYVGTTVYFATGLDQEATVVKDALIPSLPKSATKESLKENRETSQAPLTVILGK